MNTQIAWCQLYEHELHVFNELHSDYNFVGLVLLAFAFSSYMFASLIIYKNWNGYNEQCYKNKKISYVGKSILTILTNILFLSTVILDLPLCYITWKSIGYSFYPVYTKVVQHHLKLHWSPAASYTYNIYLYKLILVMLAVECIFVFSPAIVLQIMKFIRGRQNLVAND